MSAEIVKVTNGTLTCKISGVLKQAEMAALHQQASGIIKQHDGKVRFLVMLENVAGLKKGDDWSDVSFPFFYDDFIEKIAVVGDRKWEEPAMLFMGQGFRRVAIEYFAPAELDQARAWLTVPAKAPSL